MDRRRLPPPPPRILGADEIIPTMRRVVAENRAARQAVVAVTPSAACFENVVKPLVEAENITCGDKDMIALLRKVSPDTATRDAAREAQKLASEAAALRKLDTNEEQLYLLLKAVGGANEPLDVESKKLVTELLREHARGRHRVTLSEEQIQECTEVERKIDSLSSQFLQNLREESGGLWFTTEELSGMPKHILDGLENDSTGKRFVAFHSAWDSYAVMQYADNSETRKQMFFANAKRLPQNVGLFRDVIVLRDRKARLLGYENHAELMIENRLARSTAWVDQFLAQLQECLFPLAEKEVEALRRRKIMHLGQRQEDQSPVDLLPWDLDYYARLVEEESGVNMPLIAEYFPLQRTVSSVLHIFSKLFCLKFSQVSTEETTVWHEDVELWAVWDGEDGVGDFLGYLYLDLLRRENKYQGNQNVTLQSGFQRQHGGRMFPSTVLLCSFSRPTTTDCTLLNHREVKTIFHELGHAVHDLLGKTKYARFSGANTSRDFVETPSLMLEKWSWMKDILKELSCHYTHLDPKHMERWQMEHPGADPPSKSIPEDLLQCLAEVRTWSRARKMLYGIAFSKFDMAIHSPRSHDECLELDEATLYNDLKEELSFCRNPDRENRGYPHAAIGHLIQSYDVGYYSYSCAQVFADDMFNEVFAKNPRDRVAWERYRKGVLEQGGSRNELDMLEELLGRPINPEASLVDLELKL